MTPDHKAIGARRRVLALVAVGVVSLNLRPATASVAPVIETIGRDLALSHFALGLLGAIPVLCMALAPLAMLRVRAAAPDRWVQVSLLAIGGALALRIVPNAAVLFGSALLAGLAVAVIQALLPALIHQRFASAAGITALYATLSTVGAGLATIASGLLATGIASWNVALASWAGLALLGMAAWRVGGWRAAPDAGTELLPRAVWRDGAAWRMGLFCGASSLLFWSVTPWLPAVYLGLGWSEAAAGLLAGQMFGIQVAASFGVTVLVASGVGSHRLRISSVIVALAGLLLLAFAPGAATTCTLLLGLSIGAMFPLAMMMPVEAGGSAARVRELTAVSLCLGYLVAAGGPAVVGLLRDWTGGFSSAFAAIAVLVGGLAAIGLIGPRAPAGSD